MRSYCIFTVYLSDGFLHQQRGLLKLRLLFLVMEISITETKETSMAVSFTELHGFYLMHPRCSFATLCQLQLVCTALQGGFHQ